MAFVLTLPYTGPHLPTLPQLTPVAARLGVTFQGDPTQGSYRGPGVDGAYHFLPECITGTFAGHGVRGDFSWELQHLRITVSQKPFFVPEALLRERVTAGFAALCRELGPQ
jgi:hypothetical protein